ncbi:MAG: AAA family ATPase [Pseudomonadota bacterium]
MGKDSALFEDDFDFDLETFDDIDLETEDTDLGLEGLESAVEDVADDQTVGVDLDPPAKELTPFESEDTSSSEPVAELPDLVPEMGDKPIPAISVLAFIENSETRELIEAMAGDRRMNRASVEVFEGGLEAATAYLTENATPNLLLIESTAPGPQMVAQIDRLAEHCDEGVEVMVIGATNDIPLYRQLVARGVSEYLVPPIQPLQIIRSISDLFTDPDAPFLGRSIAVVGAKGGVGSSTIAHNLAWSMAENARRNTTLVDLDVSFGTTALDFNEDPAQTVVDALLDPDRADEAVVNRLLARATDRLSLFAAPATVADMPEIPTEAYGKVIETVRRNTPYVILDLPHAWNPWVMQTLVDADELVIVCQPDLASLRNGKNIIDQLTAERPNDTAPRLVLNMVGIPKRPEIPVKDFAAAIGFEPEIVLPFDPHLFGIAANNGQMISETDPASKPSLAIDHLASAISGQTVQQPTKSLLAKLMGK